MNDTTTTTTTNVEVDGGYKPVFANGDEVAEGMDKALDMCISNNAVTKAEGYHRLKMIRAYIVRMREEGKTDALSITPSTSSFDQVIGPDEEFDESFVDSTCSSASSSNLTPQPSSSSGQVFVS